MSHISGIRVVNSLCPDLINMHGHRNFQAGFSFSVREKLNSDDEPINWCAENMLFFIFRCIVQNTST